jgi:hypothetical protein
VSISTNKTPDVLQRIKKAVSDVLKLLLNETTIPLKFTHHHKRVVQRLFVVMIILKNKKNVFMKLLENWNL